MNQSINKESNKLYTKKEIGNHLINHSKNQLINQSIIKQPANPIINQSSHQQTDWSDIRSFNQSSDQFQRLALQSCYDEKIDQKRKGKFKCGSSSQEVSNHLLRY